MTTQREELIEIIGAEGVWADRVPFVADAILAIGWKSPEQVAALLEEQRAGIAAAVRTTRNANNPPGTNAWSAMTHAANIASTFTKGAK